MKTVAFVFILSLLTFGCAEEGKNEYLEKMRAQQNQPQKDTASKEKNKSKETDLKASHFNSQNIEEKLLAYGKEHPETKVNISTNYGDIKIRLFENTPLHRANFIRLSKLNFYDSTIFYRISKDFMIQGGVNDADGSEDIETLKKKIEVGTYRVPAEINDENFHQSGALAMANRSSFESDPEKKDFSSSPYNFYIVSGSRHSDYQLKKTEEEYAIKIPQSHKKVYQSKGGTPHLDGSYTVFGQVISGMSVVKKINSVKVDKYEWPEEEVVIESIEVIE